MNLCHINFPKTYLFIEGNPVLQIFLMEQTLNILAMISRPPHTSIPADFSIIPPQNSIFWLRKFTYYFLREISSCMYFHIKCFYLGYAIPPNCQLCKFLVSFSLCSLAGPPLCLSWQWYSYSLNSAFSTIQFALTALHWSWYKYLISTLCCQLFSQLSQVYTAERVWRIHCSQE